MRFFATAAKGTEPALRDELRELRFRGVRADRGGVHFEGEELDAYRACLWSRIAVRVLEPLSSFDAPDERGLYEGVRAVDLDLVLDPRRTLVVSSACRSSRLTHTEYLNQLTKDAVVDRIRDRVGARPSVSKDDADVHLFLHLVQNHATLYLDFAGEPLHRRGYRGAGGEAPLKETLASALLRYSNWDRRSPLVDPLCGSGTVAIEAALWAANVAPGLARRRFGFERWRNFGAGEAARLAELRQEAREAARGDAPPVFGSDASREALNLAQAAAERAGARVQWSSARFEALALARTGGAIVANPPYGRRLERPDELAQSLARLVDRHPTHEVALLMAEEQPLARTRRRPEPGRELWNGNLKCFVRRWAGRSLSKRSPDGDLDR